MKSVPKTPGQPNVKRRISPRETLLSVPARGLSKTQRASAATSQPRRLTERNASDPQALMGKLPQTQSPLQQCRGLATLTSAE